MRKFKRFINSNFRLLIALSILLLSANGALAVSRILLLADQEHVSLNLEKNLRYWLQKKAIGQGEFVLPDKEFVSTRQMASEVTSLLKKHQPNLTILILNSDQQILRDYFSAGDERRFCPLWRSLFSFRQGHLQRMLLPSIESALKIQKEVLHSQSKFLVLWTGSSLRKETMKSVLGDCRWVTRFSGNAFFSFESVLFEFNQAGVNLLRSLAFSSSYWRAENEAREKEEQMQVYFRLLADELWPWILMDIE